MTQTPVLAGPVVDDATPVRTAAQRLRNTLRLNAATSLGGGVVLAIAAGPMNTLLGTDSVGWVRVVGIGLIVFALDVLFVAGARIRWLVRGTPLVSAADAAWVVASGVTVALGWYSTSGAVLVGAVALMVAGFGIRQLVLVSRARAAGDTPDPAVLDESPPTEVFRVEATIDTSPALAWNLVTDHELYGRLAPNLSQVAATADNGPGLTRTCANRGGDTWHETCTVWHDGSQFDVTVDTTDYPYPLSEMRGSWWVIPTAPVTVGMDFRYRPTPGLRGRLFAVAMQAAFPLVLRRILRGWRRAASDPGMSRRVAGP